MKNRIFPFVSAASALVLALAASFASSAFCADDLDTIRSDSESAFLQLTLNSKEALKSALKKRVKGASASKFAIASVPDPTVDAPQADDETDEEKDSSDEVQMAVKVWFELSDGTKVNPVDHKWNAKEKFYVHVEAAAPVYVSLFQQLPSGKNDSTKSVQIYPNKLYAESQEALQPGRATRLPVMFEMDDDEEDEIMSMVVVRADWEGIQDGLSSQATSSVANERGVPVVDSKIEESGHGTLKCLNERALADKKIDVKSVKKLVDDATDKEAEKIARNVNALDTVKFRIVQPAVSESNEVEDVCFYMFGYQQVGHWRLTIKK